MILLVHLLLGAAIGHTVKNVPLAIILALLSHYLLDLIPHIDYPIKNEGKNQWQRTTLNIPGISLDLFAGIVLVLIFSNNQPIIYLCAFFALLPDGFTVLNFIFSGNKFLEAHYNLHQKIHFLKQTPSGQIKISNFWRFATQIAVVIISIMLLKS